MEELRICFQKGVVRNFAVGLRKLSKMLLVANYDNGTFVEKGEINSPEHVTKGPRYTVCREIQKLRTLFPNEKNIPISAKKGGET